MAAALQAARSCVAVRFTPLMLLPAAPTALCVFLGRPIRHRRLNKKLHAELYPRAAPEPLLGTDLSHSFEKQRAGVAPEPEVLSFERHDGEVERQGVLERAEQAARVCGHQRAHHRVKVARLVADVQHCVGDRRLKSYLGVIEVRVQVGFRHPARGPS